MSDSATLNGILSTECKFTSRDHKLWEVMCQLMNYILRKTTDFYERTDLKYSFVNAVYRHFTAFRIDAAIITSENSARESL